MQAWMDVLHYSIRTGSIERIGSAAAGCDCGRREKVSVPCLLCSECLFCHLSVASEIGFFCFGSHSRESCPDPIFFREKPGTAAAPPAAAAMLSLRVVSLALPVPPSSLLHWFLAPNRNSIAFVCI